MAEFSQFPRYWGCHDNEPVSKRGGTEQPSAAAADPTARPGAGKRSGRWLATVGATFLVLAAVSLCFLLPRSPNPRPRRARVDQLTAAAPASQLPPA
jgi:hypothetical protein